MSEDSELLKTVQKIHALLELLAEEKIAERDAKQRAILREVVGESTTKQKCTYLMDGAHTQTEIHIATSVHKGNLSTMVGKLHKAKLLAGDTKLPKLDQKSNNNWQIVTYAVNISDKGRQLIVAWKQGDRTRLQKVMGGPLPVKAS